MNGATGPMTAFRTSAAPRVRALDVRPDPIVTSVMAAVFSLLLVAPGLFFFLGATLTLPKTERVTWVLALVGLLCVAMGALLALLAYRGFATTVRFCERDDELTVEWRRHGKVVKLERIARADVIDVVVSDTPSSGASVYAVALGTRHGDIALSDGASPMRGHYAKQRDRVCAFLGVPPRA